MKNLGYQPTDFREAMYAKEANKVLGTKIKSITELMYSQEGRDYWKKNGDTFEGAFDLSEYSESMNTLDEYVKSKNK